jgi:hypothetical protein
MVFAVSVGQEAKVTDADIACRQDMKKEPSDKFVGFEGHGLLTVLVGIIPPEEGNFVVLEGEDAVITDGDPMGISAEVLKDPFGAIEGGFAIDDPLFVVKVPQEGLEVFGVLEMAEMGGKDKIPSLEAILEEVEELPSEQCGQDPNGDEEPFAAGFPAAAVRRETAAGDDPVGVGMIHEVLAPGMENADHSDLCAQRFGVLGELGEGLGGRAKKQVVQELLVHGDQGVQFGGEGEDYMEVFNGQEVLPASLDPFFFS